MDSAHARPAFIGLLIGLVVFVLVAAAWQLGLFQSSELWIYDLFVAERSDPKAVDPRIVIVTQDEPDIAQLDYPLRDGTLSEIFEKIESGGPVVIGLDLYRDLPEPRGANTTSEIDKLNATLLAHPNIITIFYPGTSSAFKIPPPPPLVNDPSRYGFNIFPNDDKTVRRAFLSARMPDKQSYDSFAWRIAQIYLDAKFGIEPSLQAKSVRIGKTVIPHFHGDDGGYVGVNAAGYQFLLDFRGPPRFQTISLREVADMKDTSVFKDKIVLIGSVARSLNDFVETPVSMTNPLDPFTDGVTIHGQIINQLLRAAINGDRPIESASLGFRWSSLAFWCLAGFGAGFFVRSHFVFAATVLIGAAAVAVGGWWLFFGGYWTLVAAPMAGFLATAIFVKGYAAHHENEERENLMKLFSQHTSPAVAQQIWEERHTFLQGGRPKARRLMVTALFTDLKNYSTISEKMDPDELIAWVNETLGALAQHVDKEGGFISAYMGDGMMAVFGAPVASTTEEAIKRDATSAVRCALNMAGEIKAMNARWRKEGKPLAGLRVGIYTGPAMTGILGSEGHVAYSVIGDTVNTASRLESVDKEGEWTGQAAESRILIGELTHRYIEDTYVSRYVGKINLKGKQETTEVYRVFDHEEDRPELESTTHENTSRPG